MSLGATIHKYINTCFTNEPILLGINPEKICFKNKYNDVSVNNTSVSVNNTTNAVVQSFLVQIYFNGLINKVSAEKRSSRYILQKHYFWKFTLIFFDIFIIFRNIPFMKEATFRSYMPT